MLHAKIIIIDITFFIVEVLALVVQEKKIVPESAKSKEFSELEASNKELESFCYAISHDLRAPLRRAKSFCKAAMEEFDENASADALEYMSRAHKTMEDMNGLIDDLLRLSKIQQQSLQQSSFNVSKMAEEICEQLNQSSKNQIEYYICPDINFTGDSSLIRILLENLLSNAWKYTQKSSYARVEFGVAVKQNKNIFYVKDNGVGFDMHYAYKLFTPFQRLHSDNEFEGTGVGLATAKRIVQRHNGGIWAKAAVGKGSTFYFTLE